jgi:hypothetical protein
VYETSAYLAVLFDAPQQALSIFSHLVPDLYLASPQPQRDRLPTILISLLHHLVSAHPSQSLFYQKLHALPPSFLPKETPEYLWISTLTFSLRSRNYVKFEELTRPQAFVHIFDEASKNPPQNSATSRFSPSLCELAFSTLVGKLRAISRNTTWSVIRSAYRELSFRVESEGTRDWLVRSLALHPDNPETLTLEQWLESQIKGGQVRRKENMEGRYIICRVH